MKDIFMCESCFEKQQRIDKLTEKVKQLEDKLRLQKRRAAEGFFGSSTPSSKVPVKESALAENQRKRGGAKPGHRGHGRRSIGAEDADQVRVLPAPAKGDRCPSCHGKNLIDVAPASRSVVESVRLRAQRIRYELGGKLCLDCHKVVRAAAPAVLPKALYGNQLLTNLVDLHYAQGMPLGRLEDVLGVPYSAMVQILHRLGRLFAGVLPRLVEQYRQAPVKHADETGWRTDGGNGYAWVFATERLSIFEFRDTRSSSVPAAILGTARLPGTLVTDRYAGYNRVPCAQQYCYAHLLRKLKDLGKEFPANQEVRAFVDTVAPLLGSAMGLRGLPIDDTEYYQQARRLAKLIKKAMKADAQHLGIREFQDLFRDNKDKLYQWVKDRRVPPDNNLAERDLRPTVIARKVSFGSQSEAGARTRGILMTVLVSLQKQHPEDYQLRFKAVLDALALDISANVYELLFSK
jgi:transposase